MGAPSSTKNSVVRLGIDGLNLKLAGRRCAAWVNLKKTGTKSDWSKQGTTFLLKTAFYATWLLFEKDATSESSWKHFHTTAWMSALSKTAEEREALAADLDRRRLRRDFDLSRVGDEQQRTNLARRYVETTDKIRQLDAHFRLLETAKELGTEWQDRL